MRSDRYLAMKRHNKMCVLRHRSNIEVVLIRQKKEKPREDILLFRPKIDLKTAYFSCIRYLYTFRIKLLLFPIVTWTKNKLQSAFNVKTTLYIYIYIYKFFFANGCFINTVYQH